MTDTNTELDRILEIVIYIDSGINMNTVYANRKKARAAINQLIDKKIVEYRDHVTTQGLPLSAEPPKVTNVPCTGCGTKEYAAWTLLPHQVYNQYMPGGTGHYCFPCFAKKVIGLDQLLLKAGERGVKYTIAEFCKMNTENPAAPVNIDEVKRRAIAELDKEITS